MKRTIGFILLALIFAFLIGTTCYVCGWKMGLTVWGISFALALVLALVIVIVMFLIEEGE